MNKVKKFEISVVDRTYSRIVSNLVKFYSSDSALEVIFILAEVGYEFDSAELVLSNTDGSLITRPLTKVPEGYSYEFEKNIISHYGEWKGQVILTSGNDTYVSSKIVITIEDDLLGERPPKLTDVYSWTSLKLYADSLTKELKQAVMSVEGIEGTFNANESERQSTFEANESERNTTFNNNEYIRQTQELGREEAETNRQTTFENNEVGRFEMFNANEAARQENETTRQQAEGQRQSAEITRVENENQRVLNYENMQDTINMIGKVKLTSAFENGDFSKGTNNWLTIPGYTSRFEVVEGVARNTEVSTENHRSFIYTNSKIPSGHTTYHVFRYKQTGITSSRIGILYGISGADVQQYHHPTGEDFKLYSGMGVSTGNKRMRFFISNIVADGEYSVYLDYFLILDLTDIFGAGNEPSKDVLDWIIKENGYFDELAISRDDIQQYEINQLRKAVIALGGTI